MKRLEDGKARFAQIRAVPGKKIPYGDLKERHETWRYYTILNTLRFHGVQRMEAETTAKWICREAKPGDRREIWPGIEIVIEEDGNAD